MAKNKQQKEKLKALFEMSKKALYGYNTDPDPDTYEAVNLRKSWREMGPQVDSTYSPNATPNTDIAENAAAREGRRPGTAIQQGPVSSAPKPGGGIGMAGNHPSFAMSDIITPALSLLSGLIPDNAPSKYKIDPIETYNQFAYGTGSQAIFKSGGDVGKGKVGKSVPDNSPHRGQVELMDLVNYSLINRNTKLNKDQFGMFQRRADEIYGAGASQQLLTDIELFNQNPNNKQYSGEDLISRYYGNKSQNPLIQKVRTDLNSFSGGANIAYRDSPDVEVQKQQIQNQMYSNRQLPNSAAASILNDQKNKIAAVNYEFGGDVAANGLQVEDDKFTPLSSRSVMINGDPHSQGGTMVNFNGKTIEAEAGEPLSLNDDGSATIWGNMFVPGTKTKFKSLGKKIADKEADYEALMDKGSKKLDDVSTKDGHLKPKNKYELLKFNTAKLLLEGGNVGIQDLNQKKERVAGLQRALLQTADEFGLDPLALSEGRNKKAKGGAHIAAAGFSDDPKPKKKQSMAVRMNNPGNIKYGEFAKKLGAVPGDPATDGGVFAKFPDTATGMKALKTLITSKNYKNLDTEAAIKRWTNGAGYSVELGDLKGKKIKDLDDKGLTNLVNVITMGEDGRYYQPNAATPEAQSTEPFIDPSTAQTLDEAGVTGTKVRAPRFQNTPNRNQPVQYQGVEGQGVDIGTLNPNETPKPSNVRRLGLTQILPELAAFATNSQEPVFAQQYEPQLYQPYQVSFQDRLNANQTVFNTASNQVGNNAEAQSILAAQMYGANQQVLGEEFRTNQAISNDVNNKNIGILNDAQLKNLAIRDQQQVRQAQAKSNTKAQNQLIISSIVDKYNQNRLNNQRMAAYENLTDYRFLDNNNDGIAETATHFGDANFNFQGTPGVAGTNPTTSTRVTQRTNNGIVTQATPSQLQTEKLQLEIQEKQRRRNGLRNILNF